MRENTTVSYNTSLAVIFPVKKYAEVLRQIVKERDINVSGPPQGPARPGLEYVQALSAKDACQPGCLSA